MTLKLYGNFIIHLNLLNILIDFIEKLNYNILLELSFNLSIFIIHKIKFQLLFEI